MRRPEGTREFLGGAASFVRMCNDGKLGLIVEEQGNML